MYIYKFFILNKISVMNTHFRNNYFSQFGLLPNMLSNHAGKIVLGEKCRYYAYRRFNQPLSKLYAKTVFTAPGDLAYLQIWLIYVGSDFPEITNITLYTLHYITCDNHSFIYNCTVLFHIVNKGLSYLILFHFKHNLFCNFYSCWFTLYAYFLTFFLNDKAK